MQTFLLLLLQPYFSFVYFRSARDEKRAVSIGYLGNIVDVWYVILLVFTIFIQFAPQRREKALNFY